MATIVSCYYDAIITTHITSPLEPYRIQNLKELFLDFKFKLAKQPKEDLNTTKSFLAFKNEINVDQAVNSEGNCMRTLLNNCI